MTIINSVSNTLFSFNGIEYFKNYISVVRGSRIEIFNCYEREDVLLPLTHYNEITLNGTIHTSAANLQSALQPVIYSRATLGGEEVEIIEQNNIGRVYNIGYINNVNFTSQVINQINSLTTLITPIDNPVFFEVFKTGGALAASAQKVRFQFLGGKGTWGTGGTLVSPAQLYQNAPEALILDDITFDVNGNITNLGPLESEDRFLETANTAIRDFSDIKKNHYLNYAVDGVTYVKRFTGTPGEYGGTGTPLSAEDFDNITNSRIERGLFTPSLKDITIVDPETDVPITITDNNTGNKITFTGSGISHSDLDGNTTSIDYEPKTADVNYTIPAKNTDDVFAMKSDINGMTITANQSASEIYLKNAEGNTLVTLNVGFLNNEGTTFFYNETTEKLELKDDQGNVLSEVPVSAFVSNLMQSVGFNGATPYIQEFKDAEGNVVDSVTFGISNIQGLQAALDGKISTSHPANAISTPDIANWNTAYGWGDYHDYGLGGTATISNDWDNITESGMYYNDNITAIGIPIGVAEICLLHIQSENNAIQTAYRTGASDYYIRKKQGAIWTAWDRLWSNKDFTIADVDSWNDIVTDAVKKLTLTPDADLDTLGETSFNLATNTTNSPTPGAGFTIVNIGNSSITAGVKQLAFEATTNNVYTRRGPGYPWYQIWQSSDFTAADIINWGQSLRLNGNGAGLEQQPAGYDLNNLHTGVIYGASNVLNIPTTGVVLSMMHKDNQFGGQLHISSSASKGLRYRERLSGVNSVWRRAWDDSDFTAADITKWNDKFSANHNNPIIAQNYGASGQSLNNLPTGSYAATLSTSAADKPFSALGAVISLGSGTIGTQILGGRAGNELWFRAVDTTFGSWFRLWNSGDFTQADIDNWNTYETNKADLVAGKVPASQLPAYVDDVLEYANLNVFPATGESGKIYVALDTNKTYRWSGSSYIEISPSLALGETSATAYRGDRGKTAYDHSQETGNPHNTQIADINGLQAALSSKANAEKTLTYKGIIPIDGDYNNYIITGIYVPQNAETCTNAPSVKHGKLEVVLDESNNVYQTYHDDINNTYTRVCSEGGTLWSEWERILLTSDRIVDESLTAIQTNASLNAAHGNKPVSFMLIAPFIDKGKVYIKVTSNQWLSIGGDLLLD